MEPTIKLVDEPGSEIRQAIESPLKRMNDLRVGCFNQSTAFALTVIAPKSGKTIGGLWG